jgi:hypothetical protein
MLNSLSTTKSLIKNIKTASVATAGTNTYGSSITGSLNSNNKTGQGKCVLGTPIGTSQFTIEFWFYPIDTQFGGLCGIGPYSNLSQTVGRFSIFWSYVGYANQVSVQDGVTKTSFDSLTTISTGAWHHIAVTRNSSNLIQLYLDGTKVSSSFTSTSNFFNTNFTLISPYSDIQQSPNGNITALKITKSCVYTANFTPINKQINNDANTVLLLNVPSSSTYTTDSSTYATNLTSYSLVYTTSHP